MSKYDFGVDLSQNSSTGIILGQMKEGAVVLEFGCATGRMTRYMKEELKCQVYIVEYEKSAYEKAIAYAADGLCDDIMEFRWMEKFKDIAFDAIIFADVLEHLSAPEKVLVCASKLLKSNGRIFVSIPNITHNDIVLKAFDERFDYTPVGILDDTHVHFWGLENIKVLSVACGLHIRDITGTFCPIGYTEQFEPKGAGRHILLENMLRERQCGEVYQFVVTFDKAESGETACAFKAPHIQSHVYLNTGNGFNSEEILSVDSEYTGQGSYRTHLIIPNDGTIQEVRFDPIEFQGCILKQISISQGEEMLPMTLANAAEMTDGLLLTGQDPMVYAKVVSKVDPIVIDAEIILGGQKYQDMLTDAYVVERNQCEELTKCLMDSQNMKESLQQNIEDLTIEQTSLLQRVEALKGANRELHQKLVKLSEKNATLNQDLCAYIILANNKEKYSIELENGLSAKTQYAATLEETLAAKTQYTATLEETLAAKTQYTTTLQEELSAKTQYAAMLEEALSAKTQYALELESVVNYYKNLRVVRLRAFIGRILRGIKRRVKRVLRKEEHE